MFYDMHVHSKFSTDSSLDMEEAVVKAINLGLTGIAFTDHLDIDFTDYEDEFHYNFNEYFLLLNTLKDKYSSKIDIISAVEIGMQPHVIQDTYNMIKDFKFDYIIGSTHLINKRDPYCGKYFRSGESKIDAYTEYLVEVYNNLKLYNDFKFNTMGHLDYIVRYANFNDSMFYYSDFPALVDEIFKYIITNDISFEINTSTYLKQPLDTTLIRRYKELGGKLITLGSDAHSSDRVACNFKIYADIIKNCGFNYINYFKNGNPQAEKI